MNLSLEATLTSIHPSLGPSPPSPKGKRGEKERREDDGDDEDGSICETSDDVASSPQSQRLAQSGTSVDSARAATAVQWPESAFHFCVLQRNWRFARRRAANCRRCTVQKAPSREIRRCKAVRQHIAGTSHRDRWLAGSLLQLDRVARNTRNAALRQSTRQVDSGHPACLRPARTTRRGECRNARRSRLGR